MTRKSLNVIFYFVLAFCLDHITLYFVLVYNTIICRRHLADLETRDRVTYVLQRSITHPSSARPEILRRLRKLEKQYIKRICVHIHIPKPWYTTHTIVHVYNVCTRRVRPLGGGPAVLLRDETRDVPKRFILLRTHTCIIFNVHPGNLYVITCILAWCVRACLWVCVCVR